MTYRFRKDMIKNLKLSKRTRVRLSSSEMDALKKYIADETAAYANIQMNTGISWRTVNRIIELGSMELHVAIRLRDFLKAIKQTPLTETES